MITSKLHRMKKNIHTNYLATKHKGYVLFIHSLKKID